MSVNQMPKNQYLLMDQPEKHDLVDVEDSLSVKFQNPFNSCEGEM